ncbi:MAG: FAD-dependent oxidoreductase [Victivallaceae bacterium]
MSKKIKHFDVLVAGSGVSGMTMALLLAKAGKKVLLLEKAKRIGGLMQRFKRRGLPFDTGFHFTSGFGGIMDNLLSMLGIDDAVKAERFSSPGGARLYIKDSDRLICYPEKSSEVCRTLCEHFPAEKTAIKQYFADEAMVFHNTPAMHFENMEDFFDFNTGPGAAILDEDLITVDEYLDRLAVSPELRAVLAMFAMCHGSPPSQISFANHCRVSFGLHDNIVKVRNGGDAFIKAFLREAKKLDLEIRCETFIDECLDVENKMSKSARLNTGEIISFEQAVMAIHPKSILEILPEKVVSRTFRERIDKAEDTLGFFSIHARLSPKVEDFPVALTSCLLSLDLNRVLSNEHPDTAMAIMTTTEKTRGEEVQMVNAFKAMTFEDCRQWRDCPDRSADPSYQAYKKKQCEQMIADIEHIYPQFKGRLEILETATQLTFADYLFSSGAAYGVKQKSGEFNIIGKLPLRNFFAIGQSALLPGMLGAMISAFIVFARITENRQVCNLFTTKGQNI